jgi:hypothetical protein
MIQSKVCNTCNIRKSLDQFKSNVLMHDLRENKCKQCKNEYEKERYKIRKKNREISHF